MAKAAMQDLSSMDTVLTLMSRLDSVFNGHSMGFALVVILVMVTEGLLLVGIISIIQRILIRPGDRA